MSGILTDDNNYYRIASAIRNKLGVSTLYRPIDMAKAISTIPSFKPAISVATLHATANGVYSAPSGYAYSVISADVGPDISFASLFVNENGEYTASDGYGYGQVTVEVHDSEEYDKTSLYAVQNGIYSLSGRSVYSMVEVHVPTLEPLISSFSAPGTFYPPEGTGYQRISISTSSYENLSSYLAYVNGTLEEFYDVKFSYIGAAGFAGMSHLVSASFMTCKSIASYAFAECSVLSDISFPACTSINSYAFENCTALPFAFFPSCSLISSRAFANCTSLSYASFPVCTKISGPAFIGCTRLFSVSFPACTALNGDILGGPFQNCTSLWNVTFPECTFIGVQAFRGCLSLNQAYFPKGTYVGSNAFGNCQRLTHVEIGGECSMIYSYAFMSCFRLLELYLTGSSVPELKSYVFSSTPFSGYTTYTNGSRGHIYVPVSLYSEYCDTEGWNAFSSLIVPI